MRWQLLRRFASLFPRISIELVAVSICIICWEAQSCRPCFKMLFCHCVLRRASSLWLDHVGCGTVLRAYIMVSLELRRRFAFQFHVRLELCRLFDYEFHVQKEMRRRVAFSVHTRMCESMDDEQSGSVDALQ